MPRLLVCRECRTIETLPLYDGPPELEATDPLLDNLVRRHVQVHGDMKPDSAALLVASEDVCLCRDCKGGRGSIWEAHGSSVLKNLGEQWTGFHPEYYATKDTYKEDAMRCYNLHRRPKGADCIDWLDDSRRLTPKNRSGSPVYLCHFCPVASAVTTAKRIKRHMYDKEPGEVD